MDGYVYCILSTRVSSLHSLYELITTAYPLLKDCGGEASDCARSSRMSVTAVAAAVFRTTKSFAKPSYWFKTPFSRHLIAGNTTAVAETGIIDTTAAAAVHFRSYHHRSRGYLAGLHSYQPTGENETTEPDFESFESAWEAIQSVPDELLKEFEDELWETQSKRFVYGSKQVSVIDEEVIEEPITIREEEEPGKGENYVRDSKVFRYLVWNERPNLIQTAVEVPRVGAPYQHYYCFEEEEKKTTIARPPSPISQTHLGGLAMGLLFWQIANGGKKKHPRNCVLIGAGGCSLAHTLATNLFLEEYNQNELSSDKKKIKSRNENPRLTAVEASPEILRASELWFGAGTANEEEIETDTPEPPFFHLVQSTGELYLEVLVKSLEKAEKETSDHNCSPPIDLLIIDAEDGSAPPQSMRSSAFWNNLVLASLNLGKSPVVGVNSIGTKSETNELVCTMRDAFCGDANSSSRDYIILIVAPPSEAKVTDRHKLIFALPRKRIAQNIPTTDVAYWNISEDDLNVHVDASGAWMREVKVALKAVFGERELV